MKEFKVGDKVTIKSTDWYNSQEKEADGGFWCECGYFNRSMKEFCGKKAEITRVVKGNIGYLLNIDDEYWTWSAEMFEEFTDTKTVNSPIVWCWDKLLGVETNKAYNFKYEEGDIVQIVDMYHTYTDFTAMFEVFRFKNLRCNPGTDLNGSLGIVRGRISYPTPSVSLYAVSILKSDREIIIGERGLAFPEIPETVVYRSPRKNKNCLNMEKEFDLIEILQDCPEGAKLYSPEYGEIALYSIIIERDIIICTIEENEDTYFCCFNRQGKHGRYYDSSKCSTFLGCALFPAKDQKDWSKFKAENQLKDKDLVWCWNRNYACKREVRFYDLKNKNTYSFDGEPNGCTFDYYEKYKEKWPDWALEAVKKLKTN